ncbi:MAG: pseudouridine-5'-phosphate glycosidase [Proteobacteria bacterium]|nr:pseudouridine-5'-phosphate glycosidase [Pseudomonadota bacterium]
MLENYLDILPEVGSAIKEGRPVVALESTIISHGMPYPQNIETARKVGNIVRKQGAVPATIGIIKGRLKAGLTEAELELMATEKNIAKVSRRDIPFILSQKRDGATTVATTMIVSALAGIPIFATGGIGGVHRGAETNFDISADLMELARTDVAVICAGVKSILDIGLTLEYLETQGVPVVSFGTDDFPAFYTRKSGFQADCRVDSAGEIALALKAKWDLGLKGGMVIGNPIPEEFSMDPKKIGEIIESALKESTTLGIQGKEITPFLLSKIAAMTEGKSLASNIQLVFNNAELAAKIARQLCDISTVSM